MAQKSTGTNDLPCQYLNILYAALNKLNLHLWYLAERHVGFCLASEKISLASKVDIWRKLKVYKSKKVHETIGNGLVQMPSISGNTHLHDLVGADSLTLFKILPFECSFIDLHPSLWNSNDSYLSMKSYVKQIPCINDGAERALGLTTNVHISSAAPKSEIQQQNVIRLTHDYRKHVKQYAKTQLGKHTYDPATKTFIKNFNW